MTSETERCRRNGLKAILRDIQDSLPEEDPLPHPVPPEAQEQLWTYALGLLEPDEERQVFRLLAASSRAEDALSQIRQAMAEAGVPNPIAEAEAVEPSPVAETISIAASVDRVGIGEVDGDSLIQAATQRVRKTLAAMGKDLSFLAGIAVTLGDGLAKALEGPRLGEPAPALQPVLMGDETGAPGVGNRVDFAGDGWQVSAIRVSDQRTDLFVHTSPPVEGRVKLLELRPAAGQPQEQDTGISARLVNGQALLRDCPHQGVVKIALSDQRQMVIALELGNSGP